MYFDFILVSAIASQCHCKDCKVFPNKPCPVVQGSTRCKPNWFGNYCQKGKFKTFDVKDVTFII